ncbi:hypothetical protein QTP88_028278 [Uroleucon formosanum]
MKSNQMENRRRASVFESNCGYSFVGNITNFQSLFYQQVETPSGQLMFLSKLNFLLITKVDIGLKSLAKLRKRPRWTDLILTGRHKSYYEKSIRNPILSPSTFLSNASIIVIDTSKQNDSATAVDVQLEIEALESLTGVTVYCLLIHDRIVEYIHLPENLPVDVVRNLFRIQIEARIPFVSKPGKVEQYTPRRQSGL